MKSNEFLNEVLNSSICPDDFNYIYEKFTKYQKLAKETLNEFHRVCVKNGLYYQLAYGSLLGAVRDGGQIQWDYDVDVFVLWEERERLIEALRKDLNEKFYFYSPECNNKCRHVFIRLAPIGYRTEVLHVDVFFLIGTPIDLYEQKKFVHDIRESSIKRYDKLVKLMDESKGIKKNTKKIIRKLKVLNYNTDEQYSKFIEKCALYPVRNSEICVTADTFSGDYEFESDEILETKLIAIDDGEFFVPVNYDKILKKIYGEYENIMPLSYRINELMNSYERLERYANINININKDSVKFCMKK